MIESLSLTNFQSHKSSLLTFSKGVNVIIGSSDVGKSSTVRALKWLVHNRPSGDDLISHWAKFTAVRVVFDNGTVERVKGDKNLYVLNQTELVGFGQDVPTEVRNLINMTDINVQYQLDGPFLLSESAGAVARTLNKVINLDKIDSSLSNVKKLESDTKNKITATQARILNLDKEIDAFPDFEWVDERLNQLSKLGERKYNCFNTSKYLDKLLQDIDDSEKQVGSIVIPEIDFSDLDARLSNLSRQKIEFSELQNLLSMIKRQEALLNTLGEEYEKCQQKLKSLCPNQCPLCGQPITHTSLLAVNGVAEGDLKGRRGRGSAVTNASTNIGTVKLKRSK